MLNNYDIDDATRDDMVACAKLVMQATAPRDKLMAVKVLATLDALNLGRERLASEERRPTSVVNVFDRAQVLLQQLASSPPPQIAPEAAPGHDLPPPDANAS